LRRGQTRSARRSGFRREFQGRLANLVGAVASGQSVREILQDYPPLKELDIRACLEFAGSLTAMESVEVRCRRIKFSPTKFSRALPSSHSNPPDTPPFTPWKFSRPARRMTSC
jgi:hypothetical protein